MVGSLQYLMMMDAGFEPARIILLGLIRPQWESNPLRLPVGDTFTSFARPSLKNETVNYSVSTTSQGLYLPSHRLVVTIEALNYPVLGVCFPVSSKERQLGVDIIATGLTPVDEHVTLVTCRDNCVFTISLGLQPDQIVYSATTIN